MRRVVFTLMGILAAAGSGWADEWPQYRHDAQRTGATTERLTAISGIRWQRGFAAWPHVHAELALAGGRLYLANTDGMLTCMNADNGAVIWQIDTGAPLLTTPAVADGRVHAVNLKGRVLAVDPADGHTLWEYALPGDVYANPVLDQGRLVVATVPGIVYAFDAAAGGAGPVWSRACGATLDAAPAVLGANVVVAAENMTARALRLSDGGVVWTAPLPGARTWNADPVASVAAQKIYFSVINEFNEPSSTHREVYSMYEFYVNHTGPLSDLVATADAFIAQNRSRLTSAVILDAGTGAAVASYTVAPASLNITSLPFNSWYWGSIRPVLWQGSKLVLQSATRNVIIDLNTQQIYQPNADQNATGHFVRGDEQVPVSLGGDRLYGGIGGNIAALNLADGTRAILLGVFGNETADATPLTAPLAASHYLTFPGDGYTDAIGTLIVAGGRAYYEQYGWVYCFNGTVQDLGSLTPTPSPTVTRTRTATPVVSPTVTPTATPTRTATPAVSATPTATRTATPTASPQVSATPTRTATRTATPSPSATPVLSPTASPTASASSTATGSGPLGQGLLPTRLLSPGRADGVNDRVAFGPDVTEVVVYSLGGREVYRAAGAGLSWDGRAADGRPCASGQYLAKVKTAERGWRYQPVVIAK